MNESSDHLLRSRGSETWFSRYQVPGLLILACAGIVSEFYLPRLIPSIVWLEVPLLLTVYFGLMRQDPIWALVFGAVVGLAEDSLSPPNLPVGMFGITKTLVGYFAASVSQRFNVGNSVIRLVLCFFFYCFHAFFYWVMRRALLSQTVPFDTQLTLLHGAYNMIVALPLYLILDKMNVSDKA